MYENYESMDDTDSQDVNMNVQSSKSYASSSATTATATTTGQRMNGGSHEGTSLLSPAPLNLKTGGRNHHHAAADSSNNGSAFPFSSSCLQSPGSPSNSNAAGHANNTKSKKSSPVSVTSLSLSLPSSCNTASALINATTGNTPVKINNTTPGNFTCCFPVSKFFVCLFVCFDHLMH